MLGFTDEEARTILQAAEKETRPVTRWLPLLCAASGARVGEMAQLRSEDVIVQDGIPCLAHYRRGWVGEDARLGTGHPVALSGD